MSDLYSGTDLFSELDRLQREKARLFGGFPSSVRSGRAGVDRDSRVRAGR
jgi:HSP20 family protein